jgi:cell division protein FtsL
MKQGDRRRIQKFWMMSIWIFIMSFFITELLAYAWSRVQCIQIGYEISGHIDKQAELMTVQKNLKIELARLKSPKRIAKIARERLELATPSPEQIISIQ